MKQGVFVNMSKLFACDQCDGCYSSKHSLSSHKTSFHRGRKIVKSSGSSDNPSSKEIGMANKWIEDKSGREKSSESDSNSQQSDIESNVEDSSCDELDMLNESDSDDSSATMDISRKKIKTRKNYMKKKGELDVESDEMPSMKPIFLDESSTSSDDTESSGSVEQLPSDDEETIVKNEEYDVIKKQFTDMCKADLDGINYFMLRCYLCLLENNKPERKKILKSAPIEFYRSLQRLFKCMSNGKIPIHQGHKDAFKKRKAIIPFIRKYRYAKPEAMKANVLDKGGIIVRVLKIGLPFLTTCL